MIFDHVDQDGLEADVEYDLVPFSELEYIEVLTGLQLSIEFAGRVNDAELSDPGVAYVHSGGT